MTTSFRIAHISDTHISPEYDRHNITRLKRLLAQAVEEAYDHIVITGDITGQGEMRGYRSIRRLLKYFGLLNFDRLSVTIGNHDVFGGVHRAEDIFTFGQHCRQVDYAAKLRLFERGFREVLPRKAYPGQGLFPFVKIVGPAALIGVNSVSKFHPLFNPVGSNGSVSVNQLEEIAKVLGHPSLADLKKVILIHHHFNKFTPFSQSLGARLYQKFESQTLKLYGKKDLEEAFRSGGVSLVMHGHTHIEGIYSRSGIIYSSAALNPVREKDQNETMWQKDGLQFNEISISDNGAIEVIRRRVEVSEKAGDSHRSEVEIHIGKTAAHPNLLREAKG